MKMMEITLQFNSILRAMSVTIQLMIITKSQAN